MPPPVALPAPGSADWCPETAFGKRFLASDIWLRYVLAPAIGELRALTDAPPPQRLLDIGCGRGTAFAPLAAHFAPREILAVDVDPALLDEARGFAAQCPCPVTLMHASVTALPLPDGHVDLVFCHQLLHHVANQQAAIAELYRVLAPGGTLLLAESCESFIDTWPVRWFFRHPAGVQKPVEGYMALVRGAGFTCDERTLRTSVPWWSLPDFGITRRLFGERAHRAPTELLLAARKP